MATLPPGPSQPPILQLYRWTTRPLEFLEDSARRYGECFTVRFSNAPPFVMFSNPEAIREIFTGDPEDLHVGGINRLLETLLGKDSLLLLDGQRHLEERRLMLPPFHGERMQAYGIAMRETTDRVIDRWPLGTEFPIHRAMQAITLEVILKTVFGLSEGAQLDRFREILVALLDQGSHPAVVFLTILLSPERTIRLLSKGLDPLRLGAVKLDWGRVLPWAGLARLRREVDELLFAEIARRRSEGAAGREDVLSMLIEARDEHGQPMTDQQLRDEMITLLAAGHETSATTLSWTFLRVLERPDVQEKLRAELKQVVGDEPLRPEHVQRLEYVDATIKETLRLVPIIPIVGRVLQRPLTIGGRELPAGVAALPCIYLTHRRPELWPEPERFDPDRFLGKRVSPYEYLPFGGGVRRCLGMAFAMYEMKIVLARLFQRATLRLAPGHTIKLERRGVTLAPSEGVPVIVDARA